MRSLWLILISLLGNLVLYFMFVLKLIFISLYSLPCHTYPISTVFFKKNLEDAMIIECEDGSISIWQVKLSRTSIWDLRSVAPHITS